MSEPGKLPDQTSALLNEATITAMAEALEDEYKARATYRAVIASFGPVRPFINIVEAEDRHASALLALFDRFQLSPPSDDWADRVEPPESLAEACAAAVAGEIDNAEMYDRLLQQVEHPDVRRVLMNLQSASQDSHLPAFRRCLERESGQDPGHEGRGASRKRRQRGGRHK